MVGSLRCDITFDPADFELALSNTGPFSTSAHLIEPGRLRIFVYSGNGLALASAALELTVTIAETAAPGDKTMHLGAIVALDTAGERIEMGESDSVMTIFAIPVKVTLK